MDGLGARLEYWRVGAPLGRRPGVPFVPDPRNSLRPSERDFDSARSEMVAQQIHARGIQSQKVLDAMASVPRHLFVPPEYAFEAYADEPLSIGQGQTISQPYIVAAMTEALALEGDGKVLEIGAGSGYQA